MKTYTTKTAANGATLYYSTETGKRIAKETALENERNYILTNGTVKERYELAKEEFYLTNYGTMMKNGFYTAISTGTSKAFKLATKCDWHEVSDKSANFDLERYYHMTVEEFRAEAEAEKAAEKAETEEQEVSKNFDADVRYEFQGGAGMDTSPNFATATEATQWVIDFAANHPEYTFTGGRVHDNGNCKRYPFTEADVAALNANKTEAQETDTEEVNLKEIIAEGLKQVDFDNVTKFEVGKTYYGATWEGKFNPNGAVIVKKLTVTKITPKTICTVDENGRARRSKFTEAYAGTTEGFTIGTPNGYVDIYAFNEYTPAVAAVPTDNYTVWSEAIMAIKEGKTAEVNTVETEAQEVNTVEDLLPELDALKIEADNVNEKYMRVRFALYICNHFYLNEVRKVLFPIRDECYTEAAIMIDDAEKLYGKLKVINFDEITRNLDTFEYIRKGISNETYAATEEIFEEIRDKLGDKILASELTKLADEFGIDRALLLQSDDCKFKPALFDEKSAEPAPEPTGKMKWAAELLDDYTYEFEGDWEAGNGGLARHYKRFNRNGEQVGKLVEVFTDKTSFILDHVNIVDKSIRTYYYINGEQLSYLNGEFNFLWSDKYKAGMSAVGGEHLQVEVPDGQWKKYKNFAVNNDEFFQIMSERGACSFEAEPPETPAAFTAKRDRLIAERTFANVTFAEAEKNFKAAKLAKYNADDKLYTFMVSAVEELNEKLLPLPDAEIEVKTMEGYLAFIYPETVYADFTDMKFTLRGDCSELNGVTLGTYDTPEQVMTAVEQFKVAIERGDKRFDFTNPGQNFDKRAMRDSLERAMKIALERHEGFVKLGQLTAAENELKLYAICRNALAALK